MKRTQSGRMTVLSYCSSLLLLASLSSGAATPALDDSDVSSGSLLMPLGAHAFPRLSGAAGAHQPEALVHYDVVVADAGQLTPMLAAAQALNPELLVLRRFSAGVYTGSELAQPCADPASLPFARSGAVTGACSVFAGHWAYQAGTTLTQGIDAQTTTLTVAEGTRLRAGADVVIYDAPAGSFANAEHARVSAVDGAVITLSGRGYKSVARAHRAGAIIAEHAHAPGAPRQWRYNLSSRGPRDAQGQQLPAAMAAWLISQAEQDVNGQASPVSLAGLRLDGVPDSLAAQHQLDLDNDLHADGGWDVADGVNHWATGSAALYAQLRAAFPERLLVGGDAQTGGRDHLNGTEFAVWPGHASTFDATLANYQLRLHDSAPGQAAYSATRAPASDAAGARFALATTLLEDGYFHPAARWQDEFAVDVVADSPTYGQALQPTDDDMRAVRPHRGWLGFPLGARERHGVAAPALFSADFDRAVSLQGWQGRGLALVQDERDAFAGAGALALRRDGAASATLHSPVVTLRAGVDYSLTFAVKAAQPESLTLNAAGVEQTFLVPARWVRRVVTVTPRVSGPVRLRFDLGRDSAGLWLDEVALFEGNSNVFTRAFDHGLVVVNASAATRTIDLGGPFQHIQGTDPVNDGRTVEQVTLAAQDAVVLVRPAPALGGGRSAALSSVCGQPALLPARDAGLFLWQDCGTTQWHLTVSAGGTPDVIRYQGELTSRPALSGVRGVSLELPWDRVDASDPTHLRYQLDVKGSGVDGIDFNLPNWAQSCFTLQTPTPVKVYVGANKQPQSGPFDLNTLGPCASAVSLAVADVAVSEGDAQAAFQVRLSAPSNAEVRVNYRTLDASAQAGTDYQAVSGQLRFAPGETRQTVTVNLIDDRQFEAPETFSLHLSEPTGATLAVATAHATLSDNDQDAQACGEPLLDTSREGGLFLWQDCASGHWYARVSGGGSADLVRYSGTLDASAPFASATGTQLERPWDVLDVSEPTRLAYQLDVKNNGIDAFDFALADTTAVCWSTREPLEQPIYVGAAKVAVTAPFDLATLSPCVVPVALTVSASAASEGDGAARFVVQLAAPSPAAVRVDYATADGRALAGSDYTAVSGTLSFAPGETTQTLTVALLDDRTHEADEAFDLVLSNPSGATLSAARVSATITDDDAAPTLQLSDVRVSESAGPARFSVTLASASALPVSVAYATADGRALAGTDYTAQGCTLHFAPGQTTQTVTVALLDDRIHEADEAFDLVLSTPSGATLSTARVSATITDDDAAPTLQLSALSVTESAGHATFSVTLSSASAVPVSVAYATADGRAVAGSDYTAVSGTLSFAPGETTQTLTVALLDDTRHEADETFDLVLSTPSGATLSTARATATITDDDALALACGEPLLDTSREAGLFLWQDCTNGHWYARVSGGGNPDLVRYSGTLHASAPFLSATGTQLERPWDVLDVSDPSRLVYALDVKNSGIDAFDFQVADTTAVCWNTTAPLGPAVYLGATKTPISGPFDLTTLAPCSLPASVTVADLTVAEEAAFARFVVRLSSPSTQTVRVDYRTANGSAVAGADYRAVTGTLSFAPGATEQTVTVALLEDALVEANETFELRLSNPQGAELATPVASAQILDNDVQAPVASDLSWHAVNGADGYLVQVRRAGTSTWQTHAVTRVSAVGYTTLGLDAQTPWEVRVSAYAWDESESCGRAVSLPSTIVTVSL